MKNLLFKIEMALAVLKSKSTLVIVDVNNETPRQLTFGVGPERELEVKSMDFV